MAAKFEFISTYADTGITLPERKTAESAGYDFVVAEDIIIPSYSDLTETIFNEHMHNHQDEIVKDFLRLAYPDPDQKPEASKEEIEEASTKVACNFASIPVTLDEMAALTKSTKAKPTLVPTGVKCRLDSGTYLELSVRSSCPLKYWLVMANSVGIIDADYYNNPDNEGHIYFQIINLSPFPVKLCKGDVIGQGIIKSYYTTEDDQASGDRLGGFGSTSK